jgi:PEP-CTERM motif
MLNTIKFLRSRFAPGLMLVGFAAGSLPGRAPGDVYAFSENDISFTISNGLTANVTSTTTNVSNFGGFGSIRNTDPTDAKQAQTGPATTTPAENFFDKFGTSHGQYTRADSQLTSLTFGAGTGPAGSNVVESFRQSNLPGADQAQAACSVSFQFTPDGTAPISLILKAHPVMTVSADKPGESAIAEISADVQFRNAANNQLLLDWRPNGTLSDFTLNSGSVTGLQDPYSLNAFIQAVGGPDAKGYSPGPGTFMIGYNQTVVMNVTVAWDEIVIDSVPEPSPLVLFGLGLATLCALRARTRQRVIDYVLSRWQCHRRRFPAAHQRA